MGVKPTKNGKHKADTRNASGRRVRRTFRNKLDAWSWHDRTHGAKDNSVRTILDLINHYKERPRYSKKIRGRTRERYDYLIKHFYEWCDARGIVAISDFDRDAAQKFEAFCYEKFTGRGVSHIIVLAKMLFKEELKRQDPAIEKNPMEIIETPTIERKEPRALDEYELRRFLEVVESEFYRHAFTILAFSGMRRDELRYLEVSDIKKGHFVIGPKPHVKIKTKDGKTEYWKPKTFKGTRKIPIAKQAEPSVEYFLKLNKGKQFFLGGSKIFSENNIQQAYNRYRNRAGIPDTNCYTLRKTFGYLLLKNGASYATVSDLMGHESTTTTERLYAALLPRDISEFGKAAMDRITL